MDFFGNASPSNGGERSPFPEISLWPPTQARRVPPNLAKRSSKRPQTFGRKALGSLAEAPEGVPHWEARTGVCWPRLIGLLAFDMPGPQPTLKLFGTRRNPKQTHWQPGTLQITIGTPYHRNPRQLLPWSRTIQRP